MNARCAAYHSKSPLYEQAVHNNGFCNNFVMCIYHICMNVVGIVTHVRIKLVTHVQL